MPAFKTVYICENCQYQANKWTGKCPACNSWNTFQEDVISAKKTSKIRSHKRAELTPITQIEAAEQHIKTGIGEFDRVLGGGIVSGNFIVLTGEPGIGKSTLALQICKGVAGALQSEDEQSEDESRNLTSQNKIVYISGEESSQQISIRANRLNCAPKNLHILNETHLEIILETIEHEKPSFIIIDSIQVLYSENFPSSAGSINQVRYATEKIMEFGKSRNIPIMLIGHVTKDGTLAGPRVFEHLVDTILYLEGNRYQQFRILRSVKNRFGGTNEVGVFEMKENGLREVTNASEAFLEGRKKDAFGTIVTCTMEGTRPFLVEVQALTNTTAFGYPKRTASGFDINRLQLLIAVLQKHARLNLLNQDVYINVVGGMKLAEPASDLAVALAIASSFKKISFPEHLCAFGEIGLSGELRHVSHLQKRIHEAEKLGFTQMLIPKTREKIQSKAKIMQISDLEEALREIT